ncbi:Rad1-domain-containing protein [Wolfiporia cocos MD-104 SS10]|uniref:Rad1-domain-containing protein n=1 Tax=Wolfiporia cocos (strain MD-104) TaxID=742152 RepID=A0A2H3J906_WOLCO|nr:Rad1-domain-containing protein [Wolfiporia cocos MD-104 SS10]
MSGADSDDESIKILSASIHDIRYFTVLLRGLSFSDRASLLVNSSGISVTVEHSRTLLATAIIFRPLFNEFEYNPEPESNPPSPSPSGAEEEAEEERSTGFDIPLNIFIDCLNIFGTAGGSTIPAPSRKLRWKPPNTDENSDTEGNNQGPSNGGSNAQAKKDSANGRIDQYFASEKGTGMRLAYAGQGYPLTLLIAEKANGPTAKCQITTFEPGEQLILDFDESPTIMKIILKSSWLRDALSELESLSCDKLTIIGNPPPPPGRAARLSAPPRLRLQATGPLGSTEIDYPNDSEVLETCECAGQVRFSYRFKLVTCAQRALQSSTKTSLRINEDGMLHLQLMLPAPRARSSDMSAFVEFRCLPLDED